LGRFAIHARQADIDTGTESKNTVRCAQVHFGVNGNVMEAST
jgi:hypothetical protein